jgi:cob(I)alamin adenosyltransferase
MSEPIDQAEAERHRAKMAKRKAVQDAEVAGKTAEKGLLIVHTGTGKGKSTAAIASAWCSSARVPGSPPNVPRWSNSALR